MRTIVCEARPRGFHPRGSAPGAFRRALVTLELQHLCAMGDRAGKGANCAKAFIFGMGEDSQLPLRMGLSLIPIQS
jgi:hypothetical protein